MYILNSLNSLSHWVIKSNQEAWLIYIDIQLEVRLKIKDNFEKKNFKLMYNVNFGKTTENMRKHRDTKLATTKKLCKKKLFSVRTKLWYKKIFSENFLDIEMKKTDAHE